jgi:hypothetical protein
LDIPARDLAILFRSRNPLVICETVEEKRLEALVRAVASELHFPVFTWSAASGLSPSHPADASKTTDLAFALKEIRSARGDGVWLLKDPQPHLENPATLRALRETAQDFAGTTRTLVLVGPTLPPKPELDDLEVRFELALDPASVGGARGKNRRAASLGLGALRAGGHRRVTSGQPQGKKALPFSSLVTCHWSLLGAPVTL